MKAVTAIPSTSLSFRNFLFREKQNKMILLLSGIAVLLQFAVFKYFFPFISYIHGDSFSYIEAASANLSINTYMVGYSKFLRLFSVFTTSDFALALFQYVFLVSSSLFVLFTLFYFYAIGRVVKFALLVFVVFNPLFWHLG